MKDHDKDGELLYDGPMVVLVNKASAGAAEILAAALQDYNRAVIVGDEQTHGSGTVQVIIDLNDNIPLLHLNNIYGDLGAVKVTIMKFYRVNGSATQYDGVESDIVLPSLNMYSMWGEQFYWDQVDPVNFTKFNSVNYDVASLKKKSQKRVDSNYTFQAIVTEAKKVAERSSNSVISLSLNDIKNVRFNLEDSKKNYSAYYSRCIDKQNDLTMCSDDVIKDPYIMEAINILSDIENR